jgi:hypothetical protein
MTKELIISLSGDDYTIIEKASRRTQVRFLFIGSLVGIISLASIFSWFVMLANLIEVALYVFLLAVFISWMITIIYLLTLYTLSKRVLPSAKAGGTPITTVGKYLFLAMLGLIIATPYSIMIFQEKIDMQVEQYRNQQIADYLLTSDLISQSDSTLIVGLIRNSSDPNTSMLFQNYLDLQQKRRVEAEGKMRTLVKKSPYYIQSVILLYTDYPQHWMFTIPFILVFISPALLKHYLAETNEYYNVRREVEMQIVEEEYNSFKTAYNRLFVNYQDRSVEWREIYEDPPYNTIRKVEPRPELLNQDILLRELYHE